MKGNTIDPSNFAQGQERAILDQIRNDRDLIERLNITSQELEALSKCALLGTLTCKQDMLFILRQIREATSSTIDHTALFPQPAAVVEDTEPTADLPRMTPQTARVVLPDADSVDTTVRRRTPEKFGVLFWAAVLVVGLGWSGMIIVSRWHEIFMTTAGATVSQSSASTVWYARLDHLNVLVFWEILFVGAIALVVYLKSQRDSRRFKVRPGQRLR